MISNYFKLAWRTLFKNKLHTAINILGLLVGFSIGLMVLLAVYMQFSFDNFHEHEKTLYQAYQVFNKKEGVEYGAQFGFPAGPVFKKEAPAIDKFTRFLYGGNLAEFKGKELDVPVMLVDEDFFGMFSFRIIKGNKINPLKNLTDIVITEFTAKKIFGNEDPIGKTFKASAGNAMQDMVVSAVVENTLKTSTIRFDALARIENRSDYAVDKNNWNNQHHPVFIQLKETATQAEAELQLKDINQRYLVAWYDGLKKQGAKPDKRGDIFATRLLPLRDIHFNPKIGIGAINKAELYVIMTVGLFIILIACFNFININLANAFTRSKEIGVRKCLGAAKQKLFAQLWSESFLVCMIAFFLSLILINILIYFLNSTFKLNMPLDTLMWKPGFLAIAIGLLLMVSLIAGGYPSWMMAKFPVVETLKGKVVLKRKSILRSSLIIAQFVIACIMISSTLIVYKQFKYLQNANLGINKEAIISVPLFKSETARAKIQQLRMRLASNPNILSITGSNTNIGIGKDKSSSKSTIGFDYKDKKINTNIAYIDYDYLKTFEIKPLEGKDIDLSYSNDSSRKVILTESVAKQFGEKNLVGQQLLIDSAFPRWNVVAVIPDFHLYSMREAGEPLTLIVDNQNGLSYCFIKTTQNNMLSAMETIKNEMELLEPGRDFRGSFLNENIQEWYAQERMMSIIFSIAALIAVVLSCLGLLAMVLLMIQQRVKEIGVRKVLGASIASISILIAKDFLWLVLIAVFIATPIAWLAMNTWLQGFSYRIDIALWMFLLVGVVALIIAGLTISANTFRAATQNPVKSLRTE